MQLISEAREIRSLRTIVFSGGECFLLGDELDALIAHARKQGLGTRCVTNGYWAASPRAAEQRTAHLREAGLEQIVFSTGTFHTAYVPLNRIFNGVCASIRAGLKTRIYVEEPVAAPFDMDALWGISELKKFISKRQLSIKRGTWVWNGEEGQLGRASHLPRTRRRRAKACTSVLQELAVTPYETLAACCGLPLEKIPALQLGCLKQQSLSQLLRDAPDDFLKIWLRVEGPERVWEFVRRHVPAHPWPPTAAHPCENCHLLHENQAAIQIIRNCRHQPQARVWLKYLACVALAETRSALLSLSPHLRSAVRAFRSG